MPDLHPYFRDIAEAFNWYPRIEKQIIRAAKSDGIQYYVCAEIGSEKDWREHQHDIIEIASQKDAPSLIKIWRDSKPRYWIVNIDYKIVDALHQSREIACIQIDIGNAERLDIKYLDRDNSRKYPVIIHAAVPGGYERYFYMLFDNFENGFPLWLYPIQIRLIPVSKEYLSYCDSIKKSFERRHIRIDIDDRNEGVGKKVQQAKEELIPYQIVIGEKEKGNGGNMRELILAMEAIKENSRGKSFINYSWPKYVSQQVR